MNQGQGGRGDLRALLAMLRRRSLVIVLAVVIALGGALLFSRREQKKYTATAVLLFRPLLLDVQLTGLPLQAQASDPGVESATDTGLLSLPQVRMRAASILGPGYTVDSVKNAVSISAEGKSDLVDVNGTATTPASAAAIANAMATGFLSYSRQGVVDIIDRAIGDVSRDLAAPGQTSLQRAILRANLTKLTELRAVQPGNVQLAAPALPPTSPSSPKTALNLMLGGMLGLLLGITIAVSAEQLDRRVRRAEEVEGALDLPVLATISRSRGLRKSAGLTQSLGASDIEAFRLLRTNLRYRSGGREIRSVLLTSSGPGSGKTTVAIHLAAAAAAAMEGRVLLIEADLRRPRLSERLGLSSERGLSTALHSSKALVEAVVRVPADNGGNGSGPHPEPSFPESFDVLPAGPPTSHASELLSSQKMRELLRDASESYELTIVDGPPPGLVSDVIPLMKQVDAVVLVARLGREHSPELKKLRVQLHGLGVEPLGVVANFSRQTSSPYATSRRR